MRPELAALVVHDLKNALGVLEAQLDTLRERPNRRHAAEAHRHCAGMRERFITFLMLYRLDGELKAHCDDESPRAFLDSLPRLVARTAGGARWSVGDCRTAPPFWYFDFRLVRMAMEAALHNAERFARHEIVLDARLEDGYLVLSVADDGPGLGAVDQGEASATGLGTELCRAVARAHGTADRPGVVRLFDADDGGARFELWLA